MLVRRIRKRGANIVVEANGEVLFAATGDVGAWTNRFSHRVRSFAAQEAPSNKRPNWSHEGKSLKTTFTASTTYQPGRMRVYAAIGSSAPHAYYVDQGTGIFGGGGPYRAKILPPYAWGSPSLYEHTWRPGGVGSVRVKPVWIKGQPGQGFFDKGLSRGFRSMRMRAFKVPGEGGPKISAALNSIPTGMENFAGNTPVSGSFLANLERWRTWRDAAWVQHRELGKDGGKPRSRGTTKPGAKSTTKPPKKPSKAKPPKKPSRPKGYESVAEKKAAAVAQFKKQNPNVQILRINPYGVVVQTPKGPYLISWSQLYNLLPK